MRLVTPKDFLTFFEGIPRHLWKQGGMGEKGGPRCALGHLVPEAANTSLALTFVPAIILNDISQKVVRVNIYDVNDGPALVGCQHPKDAVCHVLAKACELLGEDYGLPKPQPQEQKPEVPTLTVPMIDFHKFIKEGQALKEEQLEEVTL